MSPHIKGRRSHAIVRHALDLLINLEHRGACGSDPDTGDGAGILVQMPDRFLRAGPAVSACRRPGATAPGSSSCRPTTAPRAELEALIERIAEEEGQTVLGWRAVPTNLAAVGVSAAAVAPVFEQVFVGRERGGPVDAELRADGDSPRAFERKLYVIRKRIEHDGRRSSRCAAEHRKAFYIVSLSAKTLIYKGMLTASQIEGMFPDLSDPAVESALALVHQRFSTNTFPSWPLAHPYRFVAHNGEINTLRGNINWMQRARGAARNRASSATTCARCCRSSALAAATRRPSTTCSSFWSWPGRSLPHAVLMMIPEPWAGNPGDGPGGARVLRVPLVADGAVGRAGVDRLHRRHADRRRARSQRPAPVALLRHAATTS